MKKLVSLFVGLIILCISAVSVSAAEAEYEIQEGDTLWDIAIDHNTTVEELMDMNGLNSTLIHPKQVLKINESQIEYYDVKKGDTLTDISKAYGNAVTVESLKVWNDLSSDLIITGQQLIVNGEVPVQQKATKQVEQTADTETESTKSTKSESVASVKTSEKVSKPEKKEEPEKQQSKAEGRTFSVEATAYTAYCTGCSGITATGVNLKENPHAKVIAVDPNVIPLGTKVYVEGYGHAVAADTGGAIVGNRIDIHLPTKDQAYDWGRRTVTITILE
ncbi:cell wall-binding protein [Virgibacillus profundi]|uniref:Cell wall-binding protein n=1 Tax=Virgibacillus profundi TaxID=2024555 RepID=A0A2A2IC42_9BACI|nr:3D domain-containing protein [Virgibacillus profundi]PAV28844.1 cell wall-binding protein [Virgibacillus profundi]PXY53012.1 LysM peptidoglycan-binding domain-containing protein [Virgibacillus profundi]